MADGAMADGSTLKMLDELEKMTQDFLSELTVMERKRGGPSNMESKKDGPSDMERKRGGPSDMESKSGVPSGMESQRGVPSDMERKKGGPSGMESQRGGPSGMESKRGVPSDMESKKGDPSDMKSKKGNPSDMESKKGVPSDMESKKGDPSDVESKRGVPSDMESKKGVPSDMESKKGGPSDMESKRSVPSDMESKKGDLSDMESKKGVPSDLESKKGGPSKKEIVNGQMDEMDSASEQGELFSDGPKDGEEYSMKHPRRGQCLIFVNKSFLKLEHLARSSAREDSEVCKEAFEALNFEVEVFENLTTKDLIAELAKASTRDHSDCDALAVVFMSHGQSKDGREALVTYDGTLPTAELWRSIAQCRSLQGKPKLFFIQACRGKGVEPSVGLKVSTDGPSPPERLAVWTLGYDSPDILVMQSSFEGMYSYRTAREGIKGSVFIHFLAKILKDKGSQKDLSELLLEVTRRVAVDFEARGEDYDTAKQMPLTRTTLTKKITFAEASSIGD